MEQQSFNSIQNNFRKFLGTKLHPIEEKRIPVIRPTSSHQLEPMEKTIGFGNDDCEIGYRVSYTDSNGVSRYRIIAKP
jgi:hypothetical protein